MSFQWPQKRLKCGINVWWALKLIQIFLLDMCTLPVLFTGLHRFQQPLALISVVSFSAKKCKKKYESFWSTFPSLYLQGLLGYDDRDCQTPSSQDFLFFSIQINPKFRSFSWFSSKSHQLFFYKWIGIFWSTFSSSYLQALITTVLSFLI